MRACLIERTVACLWFHDVVPYIHAVDVWRGERQDRLGDRMRMGVVVSRDEAP